MHTLFLRFTRPAHFTKASIFFYICETSPCKPVVLAGNSISIILKKYIVAKNDDKIKLLSLPGLMCHCSAT